MAHTCPDCGMICFCNGDIDDIQWGEDSEESDNCTHSLGPNCTNPDDYPDDDESYWDGNE